MDRVQDHISTNLFRETAVMRTARARLAQTQTGKRLRVLSFGCSIGDEVATLRYLFPEAEIFGCDVYEPALKMAKDSVGHLAEIFLAEDKEILKRGPFDLINASSVLCINPAPKNFSSRFPVSRYDDIMGLLDAVLVSGGLLALTNAAYRFRHSPLFGRYDVIQSDIITSNGFVDVFERDGRPHLIQVPSPGLGQRVYRKGKVFKVSDDEELAESVFEKRAIESPQTVHQIRLSPVPEAFKMLYEHRRSNMDPLLGNRPEGVIEITTHYLYGIDRASAKHGCATQVSWPSLVGDGLHSRMPFWIPLSIIG